MGLVTANCPLTMTGVGELVIQTGETRFVVDCRVKPVKFVGHDKMTLAADGMIASCGGGNVRLKTMPTSELPPQEVVPYSVLPDEISPTGPVLDEMLPGKLCRFVPPVPSVLTANTSPLI